MKISKIKLRFCSLLLAFLCILSAFSGVITPVYADSNEDLSWLPDGYKIYKSEPLEDGKTKYYLIPENKKGFHEYDEAGNSISFSPQMTFALYGVDTKGVDDSATDLFTTIALSKGISVEDLTKEIVEEYLQTVYDSSHKISNSFAYSGIPDEDSYCATTFDDINMSSWFSYAEYFAYDLAGLNDWYVTTNNMLGWANLYNNQYVDYENDFRTFGLYNVDDYWGVVFGESSIGQGRWYEGQIAVSEYNVIQFQSLASSIISSGMAIFDTTNMSTGLKEKPFDVLASIFGGSWFDILNYNKYKKLHTGETDPINYNWLLSPVENMKLENNTLTVNIRDNYKYKVGYYVDYLVSHGNDKYDLYRHYIYPSASEYANGKIVLNGNSFECSLPLTNCSLDGGRDNTLIKGIGFFGYGLNDGITYETAQFAPTRTVGLGDISFITSYEYFCFEYPYIDRNSDTFGNDWNNLYSNIDVLIYIVADGKVESTSNEKMDINVDPLNNISISDHGTYIEGNVTYEITQMYINDSIVQIGENNKISIEDKENIEEQSELKKCCEDCTCTIEKHCKNCTEIEGVLTCICNPNGIDCECYKKSDSSSGNNSQTDDNYWKQWKEWVESCKKFIGDVPELFAYVYSWFPKPLVDFITLSIMTGFGIAVIKVILRRE